MKQILVDLANHIKELEEVVAKLRIEASGSTVMVPLTGAEDVLAKDITQTEACLDDCDPFQNPYSLEHLMTDLKRFEFEDDSTVRHFGGSSSAALLKATMDIKQEYSVTSPNTIIGSNKRMEFWLTYPVSMKL